MLSPSAARLHEYFREGLLGDVVQARESYGVLRMLGKYSDALLKPPFGQFFHFMDRITLNQYILSLARMYDQSKQFEIRSIPAALGLLEANAGDFPIRERVALERRLQRVGLVLDFDATPDAEITSKAIAYFRSQLPTVAPTDTRALSGALRAVRARRDKAVAHSEVTDKRLFPDVTWKDAESLILFAEGFLSAIGFGYLSLALDDDGDFFLNRDAARTPLAFEKLLKKAGLVS
jgi:hypothetical protein